MAISVDTLAQGGLDGDRLPKADLTHKQFHRLRQEAKLILRRMAVHETGGPATGKEMFSP